MADRVVAIRLLEVGVEVKVRHVSSLFEEQYLNLVPVDPPLQSMTLSILESILIDVALRGHDATDAMLVFGQLVPHALTLTTEIVFPHLKLSKIFVNHGLDRLDLVPVFLEQSAR